MKELILVVLICLVVNTVNSASTTKQPETTVPATTGATSPTTQKPTVTTGSNVTTTTVLPAEQCAQANESCETCVKVGSVQCVWCSSNKVCSLKEHVIPTSECSLSDARWGVCWLNYEILIIACSSVAGLLIIALAVCICCCCCCKKGKNKYVKEDAKYDRQRTERKVKADERRTDRKAKTDEIRRKYGLLKDDTPYTRFDDN